MPQSNTGSKVNNRRKRASKACLYCRRRKVRCDVTLRRTPCSNCYLDNETCVVENRKSRSRLPVTTNTATLYPDTVAVPDYDRQYHSNHSEDDTSSREPDFGLPESLFEQEIASLAFLTTPVDGIAELDSPSAIFEQSETGSSHAESSADDANFQLKQADSTSAYDTAPPNVVAHRPSAASGPDSERVYSSYESLSFVKEPILDHLSSVDLYFIQLRGCLEIPSVPILNEFIRLYFLHVHPILPLQDESNFWDSYLEPQGNKISLVLLQAMLFAASASIPVPIAEALGFESPRYVATAMYGKAKILYDFEVETCPVVLAQAALLLTFYPGSLRSGPSKPNTMWLSVAIRHARFLYAHRQFSQEITNPPQKSASTRRASLLRRIWWCCVIRDRVLSLALHRELQIPEKYPVLHSEDFEHDVQRSHVQSVQSKNRMHSIFMAVSRLCIVLTDLLPVCAVVEERPDFESSAVLSDCAAQLDDWFREACDQFPDRNKSREPQDHCFIIQRNLMYTYYFAAKLTLYHHEISQSMRDSNPYRLVNRSEDIRETINSIVKHIAEPVDLGLGQYLPISVLALAAMPLMVHIINSELIVRGVIDEKAAASSRNLRTLISLVKQCYYRSCGVDEMCSQVRGLVEIAQAGLAKRQMPQITDYVDMIDHEPIAYIKVSLLLEAGLSDAKIPDGSIIVH